MDHLASTNLNSPEANPAATQSFMSDFAEATHELLMAEAPATRADAASRLASLGKPLASPYLIAALADSAWEVRQAAAESLGRIGDADAVGPLQDLLNDGNQDALLQETISQAISSIASRGAAVSAPDIQQPNVETETVRRSFDDTERLAAIQANRLKVEDEARERIEKERLARRRNRVAAESGSRTTQTDRGSQLPRRVGARKLRSNNVPRRKLSNALQQK